MEGTHFRASEVADAIGLHYTRSRMQLKRIAMGLESPPAPPPRLKELWNMGKLHECLAEAAFRELHVDVASEPWLLQENKVKEDWPEPGCSLSATPDMLGSLLCVELKCTEGELTAEPKPVHMVQVLAQMVVFNRTRGALLYYSVPQARYRCFWLTGTALAKHRLQEWLREYHRLPPEQLRMPAGEKDARAHFILHEMWLSFTDPWHQQLLQGPHD